MPNTTAGLIIGKGGATIRHIMESSGAKVQLSQKPEQINLQVSGTSSSRRIPYIYWKTKPSRSILTKHQSIILFAQFFGFTEHTASYAVESRVRVLSCISIIITHHSFIASTLGACHYRDRGEEWALCRRRHNPRQNQRRSSIGLLSKSILCGLCRPRG